MDMLPVLGSGLYGIPWSVVLVVAVVIVGLLIIRTAFTLVKIAILVGIALVIYLGALWLIDRF
jgi:hypothetical protein